eukprot:CAMPEP_0184863548 /NCGR_PEP_ID=MMETSP0580-20130426/11560_1 /TAXON_ID=1118495 /ORGANISM="Dactyliosolen fragilissimus" /LENGTH=545 /DNA_ID=CAMNT_0027361941 /DNA_START=25 /DNA_END=1659 /DNA_ORIENTATION=+
MNVLPSTSTSTSPSYKKDNDTDKRQKELIEKMRATKEKWDAEALESEDGPDETDALLSKAIEAALEQGKGWKEGEREAYLNAMMDDDYIHPLFATDNEELEKSGLVEAFSSLAYDKPPAIAMNESKKKGNDAFANGKQNVAKNVQYYRDAINHYYEAFFWAEKVQPMTEEEIRNAPDDDIPSYTEKQLDDFKSTVCANAAMSHMQLKNWGYVRDDSKKALTFNDQSIKAWYRLAKAHQMLQHWEDAGDAIESGLKCDMTNKELIKLQKLLEKKVQRARLERQKRERAKAERVHAVKQVWKHCKNNHISLGRVPLVTSVTDDEEIDDDKDESRWHHHHPHTGKLPKPISNHEWAWPCMFLYPSHHQSDFITTFSESDMLAIRMAEIFPEIEEHGSSSLDNTTNIPWDYNNEFQCSKLAIYFEVHCSNASSQENIIHPEFVERLSSQGDAMKFYESARALKGDDGPDMQHLATCIEKKHLHKQRKLWISKHGSLWAKPDKCPVVRVHPACTLKQVLTDTRMVVPNFLVTFILIPEHHPVHEQFLKEQ